MRTCCSFWSGVWTTRPIAPASRPRVGRHRQLVNHGHMLVNGRKVDIPSYQVKVGDVITVKDPLARTPMSRGAWQTAAGRGRPSSWIASGRHGYGRQGDCVASPG